MKYIFIWRKSFHARLGISKNFITVQEWIENKQYPVNQTKTTPTLNLVHCSYIIGFIFQDFIWLIAPSYCIFYMFDFIIKIRGSLQFLTNKGHCYGINLGHVVPGVWSQGIPSSTCHMWTWQQWWGRACGCATPVPLWIQTLYLLSKTYK